MLLTAFTKVHKMRPMDKLPKPTEAKKKRAVRFPGIVAHARALGVTRVHLWFVLTGERRSPRIEAYAAEHIREHRSVS